jgi:hypothetical protein
MEPQQIQSLTATFEDHAQQTEDGVEFWLARDLQHLLGYDQWRNFQSVLSKAKTACELSGHAISDHFADVSKMVELGSGSQREIDDVMLTRGIRLEQLPPEEDVKKVERRLATDEKKTLKKPDTLNQQGSSNDH